MLPLVRSPRARIVALLVLSAPIAAQCGAWISDQGLRGVRQVHAAVTWDPDGPGPATPRCVVGGDFYSAGAVQAGGIAAYDPATRTWSRFGSGASSIVWALAVLPNGDLVAGGDFFVAGGVFTSSIARWDGTNWLPLGAGLDNRVDALAVLPNGDLVAGGWFQNSGGVPMSRVARWNGTSWSAMGVGMDSPVFALATAPNGDLYAGGAFAFAGGNAASHVARWNGASWSAVGAGTGGDVLALAALADGSIVAGGSFQTAGGVAADSIARWSGGAWQALGSGCPGGVSALRALASGGVAVGGSFTQAGGVAANRIARWQSGTWSAYGGGVDKVLGGTPFGVSVDAITEFGSGQMLAAGNFDQAGGRIVFGTARWDGAQWSPTNAGTTGTIAAMTYAPDGSLYAVGSFAAIGDVDALSVARWDGAHWLSLGAGLGSLPFSASATAVVVMPDGAPVVTGYFGVGVNGPFRWNGTSWSQLGALSPSPRCLALLPGGDLLAAGFSFVQRWNGSQWSAVGQGLTGSIYSMVVATNGDIVVSGSLSVNSVAASFARWDGNAWNAMDTGWPGGGAKLAALANGDLVAGSYNLPVMRWSGASWQAITPTSDIAPIDLLQLPDGDLVVAGIWDIATVSHSDVRRWNGVTWASMAAPGMQFLSASALALIPTGGIAVGAETTTSAGAYTSGVSRYVSTCPASSITSGAGCAGHFGTPAYAATALPWLGATFRAHGSNLPPQAVAAIVTGFGGLVSLALPNELLPSSTACTVFAAPDLIDLAPAAGSIDVALAVPNAGNLLGLVATQQLVALEVDPALAILQSTTSNALLLTVGTY